MNKSPEKNKTLRYYNTLKVDYKFNKGIQNLDDIFDINICNIRLFGKNFDKTCRILTTDTL